MQLKSLDTISPHRSRLLSHGAEYDVIQDDNLSEIIAKIMSLFSNAKLEAIKKALAQKNVNSFEFIRQNAYKADHSDLKQSIDLPEVFEVILNECTESDVALETLSELISRGDLPLIKKVVDKYHHFVSLNIWEDTWKTSSNVMEKCFQGKINLEITHYLITMGFVTEYPLIRHFVQNNDEAATHSLISAGLIDQLGRNNMQTIFNILLREAHISSAEAVRQIMVQKGYTFSIRLGANVTTPTIQPLLMRVKLSKLYDVINYAVQHRKHFNIIKDQYYEKDGHRNYLPETVLSYLAFVKQFDAMKLIIENPDCSFEPCHLVACSLFRGHHTSRYFKLSLPIYDEIFDYLMRDDIRPRVLGDDKVWIDESIFAAIRYGNERMVRKLVELGADLTNVFITSRHNDRYSSYARYSLLSYACEYQTASLVEFLIEKGLPVEGTMIAALGEPMIKMDNIDMNDNHDNQLSQDDDDDDVGVDEVDADETNVVEADSDIDDTDTNEADTKGTDTGDTDTDEVDANGVNDADDCDIKRKFYFSRRRLGEIKKSLYPQYFNRIKINVNFDLDFPFQFDYRTRKSKSVYLLNMTPLGVAIYKQKVDIVKILLFHGANPMGRCMTNIPALFCLSNDYMDEAFWYTHDERTDDEIESRYPLKENKEIIAVKRSIDTCDEIEPQIEPQIALHKSHFTTTLSETIKCVNIKALLVKYSHKLECELHGSDAAGPKRQRRCGLGSDEIANESANNYTYGDVNGNKITNTGFTNEDLLIDVPIQAADVNAANHATVTPPSSPHASRLIYRNTTPELFQLLIDYGVPAEYDGKKLGATLPIKGFYLSRRREYSLETLLDLNSYHARGGANVIIFYAKHNMISLQKFNELIDRCFTQVTSGYGSRTEDLRNVCELLSALIYPATDNHVNNATSLSTFDQKVALTSGILDSAYSDKLYDIAIEKIYSYSSNIQAFMRFTKAYPKFLHLNMQHSSGKSLLHHSNVVVAYNLVQLGLDVNYCTSVGDSLLLQTIKNVNKENMDIIYRLVIFGANINAVGIDGVNCVQTIQESSYPQSLKDFMKRCARIIELLNIMNQYQSTKCVCLQHDDNKSTCSRIGTSKASSTSTSLSVQPFSQSDYDLIVSSCVPEYTYGTLSYFLSACSSNRTPDACVSCNKTLSKNDHCRPYQTKPSPKSRNGLRVTTYIHDQCFFTNLKTMIIDCNTKSMETGFPKYIRNPTKRYNVPII